MGSGSALQVQFRKSVRLERERRGWSQSYMAKLLTDRGIDSIYPTTVAKIESGDREVKLDEAAALADLFGGSLDWLLGREPDDTTLTFAVGNVASYAASAADKTLTALRTAGELDEILEDTGQRFDAPEIAHLTHLAHEAARHLEVARQHYEQMGSTAAEVIVAAEEGSQH